MKINKRYITGPVDNTTLAAILIISLIPTLTVNIIIGKSWLSFFVGVAVYVIVITLAVFLNRLAKKLRESS